MPSDKNEKNCEWANCDGIEGRENVAGKNVREGTIGFGQVENSA